MIDKSASILNSDSLKNQVAHKKFWSPPVAILLTFGIYFGAQIVGSIVVLALSLVRRTNEADISELIRSSALTQFFIIAIIELSIVGGIWWLLRLKQKDWQFIGVKAARWGDLGAAILGFGAYFLLYLGISLGLRALLPQINWEQKQEIGFKGLQSGISLVWVFASLVIMPAIVEELLCRGFLFTSLRAKFSLWPAAVVTSAIFALAHLQFGNNAPLLWVAAIDTFVLSMVLVYLREKRGSLVAPIMLHMIKNGLAFTVLFVLNL